MRTVDIVELAHQGRAIDGELDLNGCQRLVPLLGEGPGKLAYRLACKIDDQGRAAAVLTLHGDLPLTCDRCGEVVPYRVEHEADFFFVDDEQQLGSLPVVVDQPEPLLGGRAFDLLGLVRNLFFVTAGNVVGGGLLVALVYWLIYLRPARRSQSQ